MKGENEGRRKEMENRITRRRGEKKNRKKNCMGQGEKALEGKIKVEKEGKGKERGERKRVELNWLRDG